MVMMHQLKTLQAQKISMNSILFIRSNSISWILRLGRIALLVI